MMLGMPPDPSTTLVGRDSELELLRGWVERIPRLGSAMLMRGEAGIGKSALLTEASRLAAANGVRVLWAAGVESEAHLAFAGLERLLRPVLSHVEELPAPQRDSLLAAVGLRDSVASDLFLVALGTLNLLAEAATTEPVLLLVDDLHWLDASTAHVLAFAARRLEFEPIGFLAAVRDGFRGVYDGARLPELHLKRLEDSAAAVLLDACAPELQDDMRQRLLDLAAGNPLALIELPKAVAAGERSESAEWLPLTTRMEQAFAARVSGLPHVTRTLLLVAALNDGDVLSEALEAASVVRGKPVDVDDLEPAVGARLVDVHGGRIRFGHPLMRLAIHQRATISERRAAHTALARILDANTERRAWHRAAASDGPDESVASDLEDSALHARGRGAIEAAAATLEHAARLSADPSRRGERLLRAAELGFELGRPELVLDLIGQTAAIKLSESQRSRLLWIRERFDDGIRDVAGGAIAMSEAATRAAADGDTSLAWRLLWGAALRCFWSEPGPVVRHAVVAAAERLHADARDGRLLAIVAFAAPIERGAAVIAELRQLSLHTGLQQRAARLADAAMLVGSVDLAAGFCTTAIADLRAHGRLGLLARCLAAQAWSAAQLGDLNAAIPAAEEASQLTRETTQPIMHATALATQAMLAALRDEQDSVHALAGDAEKAALPVAARPVLATVQHARGLAALASGQYAHAYDHLRRMFDEADASYHLALRCFAVGDLAEAAVRSGQHIAIRGILNEMEDVARTTPSPPLHVGLRHARALLADDARARNFL
jgi:tetratricopeptide (TPR) repeat protein